MENQVGHMRKPIREMPIEEYLKTRHFVRNVVGSENFDATLIRSDGGMIFKGGSGVMGSDGLPKNLTVRFDPTSGKVTDTSGCEDLSAIIGRKRAPKSIVRSLIGEVEKRAAEPVSEEKDVERGTALSPDDDDISVIAFRV
jgi:hypothetical protein